MSILQKLIEKGFVVLSLLLLTNPLSLFAVFTSNESQVFQLQAALCCLIGTFSFCLIAVWHKRVIRTAIKEKLLWVLVAIALVSIFWSDQPLWTFISSILLLSTTLFGVYFSTRYSLNQQLFLLAWALGISAILSLIFALVVPSYGVMGMGYTSNSQDLVHAGTWQGIYGHKNLFGLFMSLGTLVFFLLTKNSRKHRWVAWVGLCLCMSLLLLSNSKTALIVFLAIMALIPLYRALRWNHTFVLPFFIAVILIGGSIATLLLSNAEAILGAFGRDTTLTGRTLLWSTVLYKIWQRPWLGYGYGGFWRGWEGESADIWKIVQWEVPHSHNGFLDLWLDLGLLGIAAFALSFVAVYLRAISWLRQTKTIEGLWPIAYLTFLLLVNLSESCLLRLHFMWILYVTITLSMQKSSRPLAASEAFLQQKVNRKAIKKVKPGIQGGKI